MAASELCAGNGHTSHRGETRARLAFVGDVIFGRYTAEGYQRRPKDPAHALQGVRGALQSDFTLANLETPVVPSLPQYAPLPSRLSFGAEPAMLEHLGRNGIQAVTVANNHIADHGASGLTTTAPLARSAGLVVLGAPGEPLAVTTVPVNGVQVGFIALTALLNFELPAHYPMVPFVPLAEIPSRILPLVRDARASHDLLVVTVHWGNEFDAMPSARQRDVAAELLRNGVDLIVGHHPHVLQPIDVIDGGVVAYSLGNFLFDAALPEARTSGILKLEVDGATCVATFDFVPTEITMHPLSAVLAEGKVARAARARVRRWTSVDWLVRGETMQFTVPLRHCRKPPRQLSKPFQRNTSLSGPLSHTSPVPSPPSNTLWPK
jgi:poly-gamma-glutamate capsule biosynthesis protein CapA/YwtB (metallophosphatase superfamily)